MSIRRFAALLVIAAILLTCQTYASLLETLPVPPSPTSATQPAPPPSTTPPAPTPTSTLVPVSQQQQQAIFEEFWHIVNEEYLYPDFNGLDWEAVYPQFSEMIEGGLSTEMFYNNLDDLVYSLGDDHSVFLNPQQAAAEDAEYERGSDYVGIGIWVEPVPERERVVVLLTFPGSPAEQAGILARDSILSVEGQPVVTAAGDNLDLLLGTASTYVSLTVQSPGGLPRQLTVLRERITGSLPVPAFRFTTPGGKQVGYLLIPNFSDGNIANQVGRALSDLGEQTKLDGLIIDNRMNSGGYDTVMAATLGYFTEGLAGYFVNRSQTTPLQISNRSIDNSVNLPLVVLVGEDTVSFGEIFSGILEDQGRAALIGETTLGNVEILWGYDFEDGSRTWLAHDTFVPVNNPDTDWEKSGLVPAIGVSAPWDLYTFEEDPAILAALNYFDTEPN